jgi:hypothetical protein
MSFFVFIKVENLAASSLQVAHQIDAGIGSLFFLFKMFLKPYLVDARIVFGYERVEVSLVFGILARQILVA